LEQKKMKTNPKPKVVEVGLLRGMVGEEGENHAKGDVIKCRLNLAKIASATGRGIILDSDANKAIFEASKAKTVKAK
jgi:hypothetical protein